MDLARELLCMWCCYVEGLHGKTGKMVSKSVVCPWDVGNTDIIVALGGYEIEVAN